MSETKTFGPEAQSLTRVLTFLFISCCSSQIQYYDHDAMPGGISPRHMQQKKGEKTRQKIDIQQTAAKMMIKVICRKIIGRVIEYWNEV